MEFSNEDTAFFAIIIPILIYIGVLVLSLAISYWLIKKAIRTAMADHYRTVRHYERTGDWNVTKLPVGEAPFDSDARR